MQWNEQHQRGQLQPADKYDENRFRDEKDGERELGEPKENKRLANSNAVQRQRDTEEQERLRQKELLLAKMKAIDEGNFGSSSKSLDDAKNDQYKHQESSLYDFGLTFGDYKPSFLTSSINTPTVNKKLSDKRAIHHTNDALLEDQYHSVSGNTPSSPYLARVADRATVSPIEGGNFETTLEEYLLPRRARQPVLAMTKSVKMNVVSDINDEVEEMTL